MLVDLLDDFKKDYTSAGMNMSVGTTKIKDSGFYAKMEEVLRICDEIEEDIQEQEEAKIGYIAATDINIEKEMIKDINGLNRSNSIFYSNDSLLIILIKKN